MWAFTERKKKLEIENNLMSQSAWLNMSQPVLAVIRAHIFLNLVYKQYYSAHWVYGVIELATLPITHKLKKSKWLSQKIRKKCLARKKKE